MSNIINKGFDLETIINILRVEVCSDKFFEWLDYMIGDANIKANYLTLYRNREEVYELFHKNIQKTDKEATKEIKERMLKIISSKD